MQHFTTLGEYHDYMYWPKPNHPQYSVVSLSSSPSRALRKMKKIRSSSPPITNDFYTVKMKQPVSGTMSYGRTQYDFSQGIMLFLSPRQVLQWDNIVLPEKGFILNVHEDFFIGHTLAKKIAFYDFFSYVVNEALHLSSNEERIVSGIFRLIESEYQSEPDRFSRDIALGHIHMLLRYAERFYVRQFYGRKEINRKLSLRFMSVLEKYYRTSSSKMRGMPDINWVASELAVSPRYLSRVLKTETGKTAMEHIHQFLIRESRNLLLEPGKTISDVAYQLGFEYPQYFSRLFKKKVGVSPTDFRNEHLKR